MNIILKMIGYYAIKRKWESLPKKIDKRIQDKLKIIGFKVTQRAKEYAPYKSGTLENAITFRVTKGEVDVYVPSSSKAAPYAQIMEQTVYNYGAGTVAKGSGAGRMYMSRALKNEKDEIIQEASQVFQML